MKHTLNTITIFMIITLFIIMGIGTAIVSSDIDETCSTNNALLKRVNNLWDCNIVNYGEMYYHNTSNPLITNIGSTNTYYSITGLMTSNTEGITTDGENMTINKNGTYQITFHISFSGGNSGQYEIEMFKNGVEQEDCSLHRTTTSTTIGDANIHCIKTMIKGDKLSAKIEDNQAPPQNTNIYVVNYNIIEI